MIRFIGFVLMAIGGLITTLCGLCTIFGIVTILTHPCLPRPDADKAFWGTAGRSQLVLLVGGVPTVVGVGLFMLGFALTRGAEDAGSRREDSENVD